MENINQKHSKQEEIERLNIEIENLQKEIRRLQLAGLPNRNSPKLKRAILKIAKFYNKYLSFGSDKIFCGHVFDNKDKNVIYNILDKCLNKLYNDPNHTENGSNLQKSKIKLRVAVEGLKKLLKESSDNKDIN